MLIHGVLATRHACRSLPPRKRSLRTIDPSSFTRLGWFSLPAIDQYSSLLPPVGVWSVSQYQCGGTFLSEPLSIVGLVGRYPDQLPNGTHAHLPADCSFNKYSHAESLCYAVLDRLSPDYPTLKGRLHTRYAPVRRSPPIRIATSLCCPSTCMC